MARSADVFNAQWHIGLDEVRGVSFGHRRAEEAFLLDVFMNLRHKNSERNVMELRSNMFMC